MIISVGTTAPGPNELPPVAVEDRYCDHTTTSVRVAACLRTRHKIGTIQRVHGKITLSCVAPSDHRLFRPVGRLRDGAHGALDGTHEECQQTEDHADQYCNLHAFCSHERSGNHASQRDR